MIESKNRSVPRNLLILYVTPIPYFQAARPSAGGGHNRAISAISPEHVRPKTPHRPIPILAKQDDLPCVSMASP